MKKTYIIIGFITLIFILTLFLKIIPNLKLGSKNDNRALEKMNKSELLKKEGYNLNVYQFSDYIDENKYWIEKEDGSIHSYDSAKVDNILKKEKPGKYHEPIWSSEFYSSPDNCSIRFLVIKEMDDFTINTQKKIDQKISYFVQIDTIAFTLKKRKGDTLCFLYKIIVNKHASIGLIGGPRLDHKQIIMKVVAKSIIWERLLFFIVVYLFIILIIILSLPKIGFMYKEIPFEPGGKNAEELLILDIKINERKAKEVYNRSTLMLLIGIVAAICGVVIFFVVMVIEEDFMQNNSETNSNFQNIIYAIRPSLLLLFVELIAFFLLRQYRNLINDYKYFNSINLLKYNNLTISKIILDDKLNENEKNKLIEIINNRDEKITSLYIEDKNDGKSYEKTGDILSGLGELIKSIKSS
jgi:hypothetical protein